MIPRRYIEEWKEHAPWPENAQVEQDLVIERALIELFSDDFLRENLAFRGGTALHKFFLKPQAHYSEDIDLVQIKSGPIKPILERIKERLAFLEEERGRVVNQKAHNNTIVYRFSSEIPPVINLRLKIEINCREHFTELGLKEIPFEVYNSWYSGKCPIASYELEELMGTKLRALYQRSKGRDLFDLYWAYQHHDIDTEKLLQCYRAYLNESEGTAPTQREFILNMEEKMKDPEFLGDIHIILRPGIEYDNKAAYAFVKSEILEKI
jgi:predicted nucleotidyltransferase component of viral defense system